MNKDLDNYISSSSKEYGLLLDKNNTQEKDMIAQEKERYYI